MSCFLCSVCGRRTAPSLHLLGPLILSVSYLVDPSDVAECLLRAAEVVFSITRLGLCSVGMLFSCDTFSFCSPTPCSLNLDWIGNTSVADKHTKCAFTTTLSSTCLCGPLLT